MDKDIKHNHGDDRYPSAPDCCSPQVTLWGDSNCCCMIALPSRMDVNKTLRASVNFNSSVNAKAELHDDVSALGSGVPAAAANTDTDSNADGNVDARSDSDQATVVLQEQAHALGCTEFTFRWKIEGHRGKARGRLIVSGDVAGDFTCLGAEGSVTLSKLQVYDTTLPIAPQTATCVALFVDECNERASCTLTLTRNGG